LGASQSPAPGPALHHSGAQHRIPDRPDQSCLVVVLSYPHGGAARMQRMLSSFSELTCTFGTGLLPLCELAAETWRQVDNRDGQLSSLAIASIRAMTGTLIASTLADSGARRWCEVAFAHPRSAEVLLQVHPGTRFICMHRNCLDVIYAGIQANPWGLTGSAFQASATRYPNNSVAAIAASWASSTKAILDFEETHPECCRRVRYENLTSSPGEVSVEIASFLHLEQGGHPAQPLIDIDQISASSEKRNLSALPVPVDWIPEPLAKLVDQLMTRLGYQSITSSAHIRENNHPPSPSRDDRA
jgi:Sulfotransferase family